jgi:hypothetical protein
LLYVFVPKGLRGKPTPKITLIAGESYVKASFRRPVGMRPATPMNLSTEKERWIAK